MSAALLTALGEALGCQPTPRNRELPDELYAPGPVTEDDDGFIYVADREWLPDPARLARESRRARYEYLESVSRYTARFSKHAKARIRANRAARRSKTMAVGA